MHLYFLEETEIPIVTPTERIKAMSTNFKIIDYLKSSISQIELKIVI